LCIFNDLFSARAAAFAAAGERCAAHAQNQFNDASRLRCEHQQASERERVPCSRSAQLFASFDHFPFPRQFVFGCEFMNFIQRIKPARGRNFSVIPPLTFLRSYNANSVRFVLPESALIAAHYNI